MESDIIKNIMREKAGEIYLRFDEPMKDHTSFKVGGPADVLAIPDGSGQLVKVLKVCRNNGIPYLVIGNGSNLIVRDKGIRGVVVKISENIGDVIIEGEIIEAEAGILLSRLANIALENGLSGMEFASGIPGTLGGAVFMNAGAYGGEMKDIVIKTVYLDRSCEVRVIQGDEHHFGYRDSFIQRDGGIVLKSYLKLTKGNRQLIKNRMDELCQQRKDKQPLEMPSAGSVFKRPEGHYTGALIEGCELKGFVSGGAQISDKHCGFIVNKGGASAADIINLINYVKTCVYSKYGVELQTEVKVVGEE